MRLVLEMLRERVGSPISYRSIAEEAQLSPPTVKEYIQILESIHVLFLVTPYSKNIARSILKEPKIYFYDVGFVKGDMGPKLENFVAVRLLKSIYSRNDILAEDCKLHYLRTTDGREVDLAVVKNNAIETMIEVKSSDDTISKGLRYFYERHSHPAIQLVFSLRNEYQNQGIQVLKLEKYLSNLYL
jgi:predicted AAA+ superfamily ATPase